MTGHHDDDANGGTLVVSLDFELKWGVRDRPRHDAYERNLLGARDAIPLMLDAFEAAHVQATWAVVGALFARTATELHDAMPAERVAYTNPGLAPYEDMSKLEGDESEHPMHLAGSLVDRIARARGQEIGTHTFSHYYCLEPGNTAAAFRADLQAACAMAESRGIQLRSMVFPRNQVNPDYLPILADLGITSYRGNPNHFVYRPRPGHAGAQLIRPWRFLDAHVRVTGNHHYRAHDVPHEAPGNVPASRFLRPRTNHTIRDRLVTRRVREEIERAARANATYHLWWHPHNMGASPEEEVARLGEVLDTFEACRDRYGMRSLGMDDWMRQHARVQLEGAPRVA